MSWAKPRTKPKKKTDSEIEALEFIGLFWHLKTHLTTVFQGLKTEVLFFTFCALDIAYLRDFPVRIQVSSSKKAR